jgi:hypothetical protein
MEEAATDTEQLHLPEDIMPAFDDLLKNGEDQGAGKKQKKAWGPVQPSRQIDRIDRSKNVMDKAMELKEKKNNLGAAKKMTGIIKSNPLHVLGDMARKIGIHVDTSDVDGNMETVSLDKTNIQMVPSIEPVDFLVEVEGMSGISDCPKTPDQYNIDHEFDDRGENVWVHVTRKKRGKHSRKVFR